MSSIAASTPAVSAGASGPGVWSLWGTPDPNPTRAATLRDGERIAFDNLGYRISVGDDATVVVLNRTTGDHYVFLGATDGEAALPAHTLLLDDGTKLTIESIVSAGSVERVESAETASDPAGPGVMLASKVAISNHDYGVQVLGVDGEVAGGLRYVETVNYGWALDAAVRDGLCLDERALTRAPGPWHVVRAGELRGGVVDADAVIGFVLREVFMTLAVLMTITMAGAFTGAWAPRLGAWTREPPPADREPEAAAALAALTALAARAARAGRAGVHPSWGGHG